MLRLYITAASSVGCVRPENEDMILIDGCFLRNDHHAAVIDVGETDRWLIALADGMGGHNCGEVASSDTLHNLQFFFNDMPAGLNPGEFNEMICEWLASINHIIDSKGRVDAQYYEMGTTLVALAYYEHELYWMNCGDSRLYRWREGQLRQVTTDHSLNNLLGSSEHSNVITNCIGAGCKTSYIDLFQFTADVQSGDVLLLCSDGLSDMVPDETIGQLIAEGSNAQMLCRAAEDAGGYDNVSVVVIKVE